MSLKKSYLVFVLFILFSIITTTSLMKQGNSLPAVENINTSLPELTVESDPTITLVDVNHDSKSDILWIEQEINVINQGLLYIYYASESAVFQTSGEIIENNIFFTGTYEYLEKGLIKMTHWIGIGAFIEDSEDFLNMSVSLSPIYIRCYSNYTRIGPGIDGGEEEVTIYNSDLVSNLTNMHGHVSQSTFKLQKNLTLGRFIGDKYQWEFYFTKKTEPIVFYLGLGVFHTFNRNSSILIEYSKQFSTPIGNLLGVNVKLGDSLWINNTITGVPFSPWFFPLNADAVVITNYFSEYYNCLRYIQPDCIFTESNYSKSNYVTYNMSIEYDVENTNMKFNLAVIIERLKGVLLFQKSESFVNNSKSYSYWINLTSYDIKWPTNENSSSSNTNTTITNESSGTNTQKDVSMPIIPIVTVVTIISVYNKVKRQK